jgi:hypothetical protein
LTEFFIDEKNIFVYDDFFSEAGLIENMAQSCSAIIGQFYFLNPNQEKNIIGYIGSIKKMEIWSLPKVGQTIKTKAHLISNLEAENFSMTSLFCQSYFDEKPLAEAQINLFIQQLTQ